MSIRSWVKSTKMWVRLRIPEVLKRFYRAWHSMKSMEVSEKVPQHLMDGCQFISSRAELLEKMPERAVVAEVGTLKGTFARKIMRTTRPRELHLIDITYTKFDPRSLTGSAVFRHEGFSHEILSEFEEDYFDWIYIDADHSYEGVIKDADIARSRVKPGGYLIFNDFAHTGPSGGRYGVHRAVVEFSNRYEWKWRYFAYHRSALYDIALQKPEFNSDNGSENH